MRAAVVRSYGGPEVAVVADVPTPRPGREQVLVRVHAAGVSSGDARIRASRFPRGMTVPARLVFGVRRPRRAVLGGTFSGVVEEVGDGVAGLRPGDEVCGMTGARLGTHAEYVAVPADRAVPKPPRVGHDDAAAVLFGGTTAMHYLRDKGEVAPGQSVLVVGATGAVGTNAVQLASHLGAEVTAVCSERNAALVRRLGASVVLDRDTPLTSAGDTYDVVLDTVGALRPRDAGALLNEGGRLLLVVADLPDTLRARGPVRTGPAPERPEDMAELLRLVDDGTLEVLIERVLTLDEITEAHRIVDTGHKVGNVVVHP